MKKIEPHDGLVVGPVSDDDDCNREGLPEHHCSCNCGDPGCYERVWRVGKSDDCAVCHARRTGTP